MSSGINRRAKWVQNLLAVSLLVLSAGAMADEVVLAYIDDDGETQILTVDANSSDEQNALAATLILGGAKITVIEDGKNDLSIIADAISAHAPDNATVIAVRNTILGVQPFLGGRSVPRSAEMPDAASPPPTSTPPVPFPARPIPPRPPVKPPVVSPN